VGGGRRTRTGTDSRWLSEVQSLNIAARVQSPAAADEIVELRGIAGEVRVHRFGSALGARFRNTKPACAAGFVLVDAGFRPRSVEHFSHCSGRRAPDSNRSRSLGRISAQLSISP
jgi:hypothetical protein